MQTLSLKNIYAWPLLRRILVLILIFAVIVYLGYFFDLSHLKNSLSYTKDQETDLKQQVVLMISKEYTLKSELAPLSELRNLLGQWQKRITTFSNIPTVLNEILRIGATNHIYFALFNPENAATNDDLAFLPIHVIGVGNYHELAMFISQVANMPWLVVIGNYTISNENKNDVLGAKLAQEASTQGLLTADLNFDIYFMPQHLPEKQKGKEHALQKSS